MSSASLYAQKFEINPDKSGLILPDYGLICTDHGLQNFIRIASLHAIKYIINLHRLHGPVQLGLTCDTAQFGLT